MGMLDASVVIGIGRTRVLGRVIVSDLVSDYKHLRMQNLASHSFGGDS